MSSEVSLFNFHGKQIRVVLIEGEPWWIAGDVCALLEISNSRDAIGRLDADERNTVALTDGTPGNPNRTIVNESGLYSLILSSRKPEAKAFKRWVTHEVLPQIRRTGAYGREPAKEAPVPEAMMLVFQALILVEQRLARVETVMRDAEGLPPATTRPPRPGVSPSAEERVPEPDPVPLARSRSLKKVSTSADQLLTIEEARALCKIGRTTFYAMVREGAVPSMRIGKSIRISRKALDRFIDSQHSRQRR